jgi:hypothetical protein
VSGGASGVMRRLFCAAVPGLLPGTAMACALPPSIILTLPTGHYILAAALAVAASVALGAMSTRLPRLGAERVAPWPGVPRLMTSAAGTVAFGILLLIGVFGPSDPMHNLLTLVFWTGVWIALPLASMLCGNLWPAISPWLAPVRLVRTALGRHGTIGLARLGHLPAVLGLLGFAWFQTVSPAPDDPATLATAAGLYWLAIFALAVLEGEDWLETGEFLTVLFGFLSRVAPIWREGPPGARVLMAGWPGAQILRLPPLGLSAILFVTLALAALTFDGLVETFWWQGLIGQNPLEPEGRSAVMAENTAGLFAVWTGTLAVTLGGLWAGAGRLRTGPVMLSFLAIAAGYHAAHYLVILLTAGQYTLAALNDPLFRGDSLLGLPPFYVSFGFLTNPDVMPWIYGTQFALILGAHLLAVLLALRLAGPGAGLGAHGPMGLLMVGYTILGLWLLSTARSG